MTIKADLGFINIAPEVLADIAGYAAMSCFGVKGMTIRSVSDGIAHLLRRENMSRGVRITEAEDGGVNIDLHLAVEHGVNIATICRSIINEVRYNVEKMTGIDVKNVDIYVDAVRAD
ncbi:MAG: Asp23/Gls24 family envelope stress response protein [Eubacteriales bacterium]|nr:Asp23/Gls24 family envelope stress response protein [Eubacteriales bacterium]